MSSRSSTQPSRRATRTDFLFGSIGVSQRPTSPTDPQSGPPTSTTRIGPPSMAKATARPRATGRATGGLNGKQLRRRAPFPCTTEIRNRGVDVGLVDEKHEIHERGHRREGERSCHGRPRSCTSPVALSSATLLRSRVPSPGIACWHSPGRSGGRTARHWSWSPLEWLSSLPDSSFVSLPPDPVLDAETATVASSLTARIRHGMLSKVAARVQRPSLDAMRRTRQIGGDSSIEVRLCGGWGPCADHRSRTSAPTSGEERGGAVGGRGSAALPRVRFVISRNATS